MTPQESYRDEIDQMLIDVRNRIAIAADQAVFPEMNR